MNDTPDIEGALEDLLAAARKVEWSAGQHDWPQCSCCHHDKLSKKGHSATCALDKAIRYADEQIEKVPA